MSLELTPESIRRLRAARKAKKMTQLEVSNEAKVSLRTLEDLESGRRTTL